jgi:VanZ family protein
MRLHDLHKKVRRDDDSKESCRTLARDGGSLPGERKDAVTKLVMLTRMGAGLAVLTIIVLSVVPGNMRPNVLGNDLCEHFAAYFITGSLLAAGYLRPLQLLSSGVLLAICGGSLEFAQLWIPGRTASAGDFASSAVGAWIGLLLIVVVRRAHGRKFAVSHQ